MRGSSKLMLPGVIFLNEYTLWRKAPYNAKPTKVADPMANPFPIAAVVFPAASRISVLCLTSYGS